MCSDVGWRCFPKSQRREPREHAPPPRAAEAREEARASQFRDSCDELRGKDKQIVAELINEYRMQQIKMKEEKRREERFWGKSSSRGGADAEVSPNIIA